MSLKLLLAQRKTWIFLLLSLALPLVCFVGHFQSNTSAALFQTELLAAYNDRVQFKLEQVDPLSGEFPRPAQNFWSQYRLYDPFDHTIAGQRHLISGAPFSYQLEPVRKAQEGAFVELEARLESRKSVHVRFDTSHGISMNYFFNHGFYKYLNFQNDRIRYSALEGNAETFQDAWKDLSSLSLFYRDMAGAEPLLQGHALKILIFASQALLTGNVSTEMVKTMTATGEELSRGYFLVDEPMIIMALMAYSGDNSEISKHVLPGSAMKKFDHRGAQRGRLAKILYIFGGQPANSPTAGSIVRKMFFQPEYRNAHDRALLNLDKPRANFAEWTLPFPMTLDWGAQRELNMLVREKPPFSDLINFQRRWFSEAVPDEALALLSLSPYAMLHQGEVEKTWRVPRRFILTRFALAARQWRDEKGAWPNSAGDLLEAGMIPNWNIPLGEGPIANYAEKNLKPEERFAFSDISQIKCGYVTLNNKNFGSYIGRDMLPPLTTENSGVFVDFLSDETPPARVSHEDVGMKKGWPWGYSSDLDFLFKTARVFRWYNKHTKLPEAPPLTIEVFHPETGEYIDFGWEDTEELGRLLLAKKWQEEKFRGDYDDVRAKYAALLDLDDIEIEKSKWGFLLEYTNGVRSIDFRTSGTVTVPERCFAIWYDIGGESESTGEPQLIHPIDEYENWWKTWYDNIVYIAD